MTTRDEWDYENAEVHEGEREVMSVYCVRFAATEIADIRAAAKREGVTTSEFIRAAARSRTKTQALPAELVRALGVVLVDTYDRYAVATDSEGGQVSAEDLASWLNEHSSKAESAERAARIARAIVGA